MKRYKRGYIEHEGSYIDVQVAKITVTEDCGLEEIEEDWLAGFSGFESKDEAIQFLKQKYNVKEIVDEDYKIIKV